MSPLDHCAWNRNASCPNLQRSRQIQLLPIEGNPCSVTNCTVRVTNRFDVAIGGLIFSFPFGFQSSSMVERAAVNRDVVGSSPTSGAISIRLKSELFHQFCFSLKRNGLYVTPGLSVSGSEIVPRPEINSPLHNSTMPCVLISASNRSAVAGSST